MDKKEFLLKILTRLEPVWDLAKWLKVLLEYWNLDDNLFNALNGAIQGAISTAKNGLEKQKLQRWLDAMKRMKELENESRMSDEKDLLELDHMLDNI